MKGRISRSNYWQGPAHARRRHVMVRLDFQLEGRKSFLELISGSSDPLESELATLESQLRARADAWVMKRLGITAQDVAETMPPPPEGAR